MAWTNPTVRTTGELISASHWNTDLVDNLNFLKAAAWPVGSIFISVVSTNPATLLGFGTWTAFAAGRTLVGLDSGQTEFDTVEETGGSKTHTLTVDEIPSHSHTQQRTTAASGSSTDFEVATNRNTTYTPVPSSTATTGGGQAHNNLQPYIVTYMWKRTA